MKQIKHETREKERKRPTDRYTQMAKNYRDINTKLLLLVDKRKDRSSRDKRRRKKLKET